MGSFFTTFIAQPIFNLLVLIYALLPGHNFGLAIILFTVIVRLLLWPLLRKQLHQTKMMRKLQPELKRIKKETKGDRQKESTLVMALYKEAGVSPFSQIGILLIQLPILIGLYNGLRLVVNNPKELISFAYPALQHLPWMQELAHNIHRFDATFLSVVDLTKAPLHGGAIYIPALLIAVPSVIVQYFQAKQLMVTDKNARSLREIMRAASNGEQADQAEVSAAMSRFTVLLLPVMVLFFVINLPAALGLYWLTSSLVALAQQTLILREDETELENLADKSTSKNVKMIPEAEIVSTKANAQTKTTAKARRGKRRKRK